jgi:hypothetical protein
MRGIRTSLLLKSMGIFKEDVALTDGLIEASPPVVVAEVRVPVGIFAVFVVFTGIDLVSITCPRISHIVGRAPDIGIVRPVVEALAVPFLRTVNVAEDSLET